MSPAGSNRPFRRRIDPSGGEIQARAASERRKSSAFARHWQRGFTLIELMVTLALATLLLALVPPLLGKGGDRARLDHDTRLLADSLRLARSRAIAGDREVTVRFEPEANRFGIDGVERTLSQGVAATIETPADEPGILRFYPEGSASGALIRLANDSGSRTLSVDWLTGAVERAP